MKQLITDEAYTFLKLLRDELAAESLGSCTREIVTDKGRLVVQAERAATGQPFAHIWRIFYEGRCRYTGAWLDNVLDYAADWLVAAMVSLEILADDSPSIFTAEEQARLRRWASENWATDHRASAWHTTYELTNDE